jgi:hypothetical protein
MANVDLAVLTWRKSRACEETNCVEAATAQGLVMVRDSGNAESVTLTFPSRDWAAFVSHMRDDDLHARFPLPGREHSCGTAPTAAVARERGRGSDGKYSWRSCRCGEPRQEVKVTCER